MSRPRSIVIGVDFSGCSASALRQAARIARQERARLEAVHVIAEDVVGELESVLGGEPGTVRHGLIQDAEREWQRFISDIPEAHVATLRVEIDHPVAALLRRAAELHAELLVLGVFGVSGHERGAGTVATACVRKAASPVLLVHESHGGPFRSVVACVDFSAISLQAAERAARIALQDGASLHVLHVFDPPWQRLHYRAPTPQATPDFHRQFCAGLRGRLESFCQPVSGALAQSVAQYHVFEHAGHGDGITEFVEEHGVDLAVLGTRGRANLRYLVWGRTAERVVRNAPCSVLVVRPETTPETAGHSEAAAARGATSHPAAAGKAGP